MGELLSSRPIKGESLLELADEYIALDIETTGLSPEFDDIIEVAAVKISGGKEICRFQSLINPHYSLPAFIVDLTGITDEMVASAPDLTDVLSDFREFLGEYLLVGHNVNFDINFIYDRCVSLALRPLSNNFVDTMRLSRKLYPEWKNHRLSTMIKELGIGESVEHRALGDCLQTAQSYEHLKQYAMETNADLSSRRSKGRNLSAKDLTVQVEAGLTDPDSPIYGKVFVFTGALEKMLRREAMQIVLNIGGLCGDSVTKETDYLVLGNNDYCSTIKDGKSSKQKKAEKMILSGHDISIISENVFYDMLGE